MAGCYARKVHKDFDLVTITVTLPERVYLANTISVSFDAKRRPCWTFLSTMRRAFVTLPTYVLDFIRKIVPLLVGVFKRKTYKRSDVLKQANQYQHDTAACHSTANVKSRFAYRRSYAIHAAYSADEASVYWNCSNP